MAWSRLSGSVTTPKVDVAIDMGNPFLNLTVDGFLKIGLPSSFSFISLPLSFSFFFSFWVTFSENLTASFCIFFAQVAATRAAAEDAYHILRKGNISQHNFAQTLKKICKEGAYWGTVVGVYVGMEYGAERIRGTRDWKNAMMGGAVTGALVSAASSNNKDKIVMDAITGCAVAAAAEFLNYLV